MTVIEVQAPKRPRPTSPMRRGLKHSAALFL